MMKADILSRNASEVNVMQPNNVKEVAHKLIE